MQINFYLKSPVTKEEKCVKIDIGRLNCWVLAPKGVVIMNKKDFLILLLIFIILLLIVVIFHLV